MDDDHLHHHGAPRRSWAIWSCLVALLTLSGAACSNSNDDPQIGAPQYVDSTTQPTREPDSEDDHDHEPQAPTLSTLPSFVEDHAGAEAENHDHIHSEFGDLEGFGPPDARPAADPGDPQAVALSWGCAYRAKPAGEGTDAWVARLAPLMTDRAIAKMSAMSSPPQLDSDVARPLGAVEIEPASEGRGPKFRVNCDVRIVNAEGSVIADGAVAPVLVILAQTSVGWQVDDFSYGGVRFDA